MTNRKIQYWVIPPTEDGEFVAHRSEVLDTYAQPYNPKCPVLCMDEQPIQLQREVRTPFGQPPKDSIASPPHQATHRYRHVIVFISEFYHCFSGNAHTAQLHTQCLPSKG